MVRKYRDSQGRAKVVLSLVDFALSTYCLVYTKILPRDLKWIASMPTGTYDLGTVPAVTQILRVPTCS